MPSDETIASTTRKKAANTMAAISSVRFMVPLRGLLWRLPYYGDHHTWTWTGRNRKSYVGARDGKSPRFTGKDDRGSRAALPHPRLCRDRPHRDPGSSRCAQRLVLLPQIG